jgi:anti-sigma factor RsiW
MADRNNALSLPCKELEENLVLFHYGDLADTERDALQVHLGSCAGCADYLKELTALLPLTIKTDEPPQTFWTDYSRELRHKIAEASEKKSWRQRLGALFQPRLVPVFAAAAVVALALTLTLGKSMWRTNDSAQEDAAMLEILPVAENLEFFNAMDVLDDLDLLESMGNQSNAA